MEIIHLVLGKANPDRLNGVNKVVFHLASQQARAGRAVQVWGISRSLEHNYPERDFETLLFPASVNPFGVCGELKTAILAHRDSVFHLHGGWVPVYSTLARFFAAHQVRFVLTPHGAYNTIAMQRSRLAKALYFRCFERQLLQRAFRVHAIGQSEIAGLEAIFPNDKSVLIPYGFSPSAQDEAWPEVADAPFTLGFVGRLDVYTKGLDLLLAAFARFQRQEPSARLWIVGEGKERPYLEKTIQMLGIANVVLYGAKFGEEKNRLIAQMHAFAHPSRNEGLPTAVLEAAALGVPSIVTQATNLAGYVNRFHAGIGVADEDETALLKAIGSLAQAQRQPARWPAFSSNARLMLAEAFAWPVLLPAFDQLYRS